MDALLNPSVHVRDPVFIQTNSWVHPQYVMRRMEVVYADGFRCNLLASGIARRIGWKLDKYLCMIPESVEVSS